MILKIYQNPGFKNTLLPEGFFGSFRADAFHRYSDQPDCQKEQWTWREANGKWIRNTVKDAPEPEDCRVVEILISLSLKENMDALVLCAPNDRRAILVKTKPGNITHCHSNHQRSI